MSSPWRVLGIPKGSDRTAIRRGYAKKLKTTNPEDDPEKFKRLREAYEHALQIASWSEHEVLADEPAGSAFGELGDFPDPPDQQQAPPPEQADPEAEELDGLVDALEAQLASPWRDDVRANALFDQILGHPGMDSLDGRTRVEFRIGAMIASHVPASDAILLLAIRTFEWTRVGRAEQWPFVAALHRHEEWKLIAAFERPGHPFHRAWSALTKPPATRWSRAVLAHSHHGSRIAELLDIIDYQSNGLLPSTLPAEVAWWRTRTEKGTIAIASYAWAVLVGVLVWGMLTVTGASSLMAIGMGLANTIALAFDRFGIERGYQRLGLWWNRQRGGVRSTWRTLMRTWPLLMAMVPFLALLLPATWAAASLVATLCVIALLGLRLSGEGQMTPLAIVWSAAAVAIVALGVAAGGQLPPPLPRFLMLLAVGAMFTQPLIAARPVLLELADARTRNHGAFLFLAYAILFAGTAWYAVQWGLVDSVSSVVLVALILWVMSPLIAASHLMAANIASRIARGLTVFAMLTLMGLANPVNVETDMTNGDAIVALHLGLRGDPLPQVAAAIAEMQRRNPGLHRRIEGALPQQPIDGDKIDNSAFRINQLIDEAVPRLLPATSARLAGRYQRVKIDLLYAIRMTDAAKCADGMLQISPDLDLQARRESFSVLLAIAAHGRSDVQGNRLADLPRKADYDKAVETLRPTVDATRVQQGVAQSIRDRCTDRIARAQALADLPDEQIAAVLGLPTVEGPAKR